MSKLLLTGDTEARMQNSLKACRVLFRSLGVQVPGPERLRDIDTMKHKP